MQKRQETMQETMQEAMQNRQASLQKDQDGTTQKICTKISIQLAKILKEQQQGTRKQSVQVP